MAGKRKETMDIREMLRHLQRGQSNRAVAKALGIDRKTVARYRTWAKEQGLLEESLPSLSELQQLVEETLDSSPPPQKSTRVAEGERGVPIVFMLFPGKIVHFQ